MIIGESQIRQGSETEGNCQMSHDLIKWQSRLGACKDYSYIYFICSFVQEGTAVAGDSQTGQRTKKGEGCRERESMVRSTKLLQSYTKLFLSDYKDQKEKVVSKFIFPFVLQYQSGITLIHITQPFPAIFHIREIVT